MKILAFVFAAGVLASAGMPAAPPQGAPAAATVPCASGQTPMTVCPMMGPDGTMLPCPAMQGGAMGSGKGQGPGMAGKVRCPAHCACPPMKEPGAGAAHCSCACPGMRTAAPGAASKMGAASAEPEAGSTNPAVYGWQLMTAKEKAEYRARLRAAKTPEERAEFRAEHDKEMQARAKQRGITLPPPASTG